MSGAARHPISAPELKSYLDDLEDLDDPGEAALDGGAAPLPSDVMDHIGIGQNDDLVQAADMRHGDHVHQDVYAGLQAELLKHDSSEERLVPYKKQKRRNHYCAPSSDESDSGDEAGHGRIAAGRFQPIIWKVSTAFALGVAQSSSVRREMSWRGLRPRLHCCNVLQVS